MERNLVQEFPLERRLRHQVHQRKEIQPAVVANDGALFEGDPVALTGAFALGLALQQDTGAVDPHAGHNHG